MKKAAITSVKLIGFFLGWAVLATVLPLPDVEDPAVWRLWAEIMPLLAMIAVTLLFWFIEKKKVALHLFGHAARGAALGAIAGALWLAVSVLVMSCAKVIHFEGINPVKRFPVWMLAAFLNVVMQELLVRGYLYQMLKQRHSLAAAAIVTSALFTALHGGAFEAGVIPVLNVLTMSLLMTAVLEYSGSLVAPTVMHFLWNGIGALILGGVSLADDYPSLLKTAFTGNDILSGGACKIEGSIVVLLTNVLLLAVFISLKNKQRVKR